MRRVKVEFENELGFPRYKLTESVRAGTRFYKEQGK